MDLMQSCRIGTNASEKSRVEPLASLVASTALSVVRDRSISSSYGCFMSIFAQEGASETLPPLDAIFSPVLVDRLKMDIRQHLDITDLKVPLYSGEGDLLGQLSRLLVVCNETLFKEEPQLIENANAIIEKRCLHDEASFGCEHIKHLRNAVLHGHFEAIVDEDNPFRSVFHFWDIRPNIGSITGDYRFTASDLNVLIDILIQDVCLTYLKAINWSFD